MQIQPQYIRTSGLVLVGALLCLVCVFGFRAGRDLARARLAIQQAQGIVQGLGYFYADQDRFPSSQELADPAVFGVYASPIPLHTVASKTCPEVLAYESLTLRTFSVTYCIPRAAAGFTAGIQELTNRDIGI